jgi:predicted Zn finger-like uncharacterized protein
VRIIPKKPNREVFLALQPHPDGIPARRLRLHREGVLGLIVTCEECSTSFQLDETRIPESGAQVRCSRCKHAFFLAHPSASQAQAADSIAEEAVHDPMSSVPPPVSDLGSTAESAVAEMDPDEEDWQFSEEIRTEDDDLEPDSDFGVSQDFGSGLDAEELLREDTQDAPDQVGPADSSASVLSADPGSSTGSGLELESSPESLEPVRDESDFGSVDDFSSLMEDDDVAPLDLAGELESELKTAESSSPIAGRDTESGRSDDLGDPESWDLVGSHDFAATKPQSGTTDNPFLDDALGSEHATAESGASLYEDEIGPKARLWRSLASIGNTVGWLATIVVVIGVLGLGLRSEWIRLGQTPQTVSVGAMTAETTQASWIETSRSGFILVVAGQIRNTGSIAIRPGTVQLALLDADGGRLVASPIQAGERLEQSIIRESSPYELIASASAAALDLREKPLAPGESRAFEAIALEDHLPEGARRILLEVGESTIVVEQVEPVQVEEVSDFSP